MSTTPYDAFRAAHQPGTASGAPWTMIYGSVPIKYCMYITSGWCDDGLCLECEVYPTTNQTFVNEHPREWVAKVSINRRSTYLDAGSITFNWKYTALYYGWGGPPGTSSPITSSIGDASFDDTVIATNYGSEGIPHSPWVFSSQISHNGSTALELSPDGNYGYIPISISLIMKANHPADFVFFDLRAIDFQILSYAGSPSPNVASVGLIVGTVIGGIVLLLVAFLVVLRYRRERRKEVAALSDKGDVNHNIDTTSLHTQRRVWSPNITNAAPLPPSWEVTNPLTDASLVRNTSAVSSGTRGHIDRYPDSDGDSPSPKGFADLAVPPHPIPPWALPYNGPIPEEDVYAVPEPAPSSSNSIAPEHVARRRQSTVSDGTSSLRGGSPPVYGSSAAFSIWANSNRDSISEDLEAKLLAAGYMPRDDPDSLGEAEWRAQHGVTKLELMRMRRIYARDQNMYA